MNKKKAIEKTDDGAGSNILTYFITFVSKKLRFNKEKLRWCLILAELKYHKWLCEKLKKLEHLQHRKKSLSRHEQRYTRGVQKRIASLLKDPAISSADIDGYKQIIKDYGFTVKQAVGKQPIFYGKVTPQIAFLDEGIIGVIWLGKFKLKACA